MEVRLDGRSAIITGASMGLGLAMAKEFAASGADVAILARRRGETTFRSWREHRGLSSIRGG